jgi:hypothetical protein
MTLTEATTRARASAGDQACTAANAGTMNRPPAIASPPSAASSARPLTVPSTAAGPAVSAPGASRPVSRAMARAKTPIIAAPRGTSDRFGVPDDAHAASADPAAMPTTNTVRHKVTTPSLPPMPSLTSAGSSDRATEPTSQNHDTMWPPLHRRASPFSSRSSATVEVHGLAVMARPGAAGPATGMVRARAQEATASATMMPATSSGVPALFTATPPAMVPARMARNVAPSTSALPAGSSAVLSFSGRMPYLTGPNRAATTPKSASVTNRIATECRKKPVAARPAIGISASLMAEAMEALSKRSASSPPSAERMKKGAMKTIPASVTSTGPFAPALEPAPPRPNRISMTRAFFRKLSLRAEQSWHQNNGAKRRDDMRSLNMRLP